jgi:Icc-related predicted phosphoesterase
MIIACVATQAMLSSKERIISDTFFRGSTLCDHFYCHSWHSSFLSRSDHMPFKAVLVADPAQPKPEGAVRLLCLSDTHGLHNSIPSEQLYPADILIFAGDFSLLGNPTHIDSFKSWLHSLQLPSVIIAGNSDYTFDLARLEQFASEKRKFCTGIKPIDRIKTGFLTDLKNIIYLEDCATTVKGVKIWGSPYSPEFNDSAFPIEEDDGAAKWAAIPDDADVVISHGPPIDIADEVLGGFHAGCPELRKAIERTKPALLVFGHIHEAHGVGKLGDTLCVNVAIVNVDFKLTNGPVLVDLIPV